MTDPIDIGEEPTKKVTHEYAASFMETMRTYMDQYRAAPDPYGFRAWLACALVPFWETFHKACDEAHVTYPINTGEGKQGEHPKSYLGSDIGGSLAIIMESSAETRDRVAFLTITVDRVNAFTVPAPTEPPAHKAFVDHLIAYVKTLSQSEVYTEFAGLAGIRTVYALFDLLGNVGFATSALTVTNDHEGVLTLYGERQEDTVLRMWITYDLSAPVDFPVDFIAHEMPQIDFTDPRHTGYPSTPEPDDKG